MSTSIDKLVFEDDWSDLTRLQQKPQINVERMYEYRRERLREQLRLHDADFCILLNPISLRYAVDYRSYQLFQSHIPTVYLSLVGRSLNNIKPGQPGASAWTAGIDIDDYKGSIPKAVRAAGGRYWAQYYRQLTANDLKDAHELGIQVFVWTVDSTSEMVRLIEMGVDGIITNRPDLFQKIFNAS